MNNIYEEVKSLLNETVDLKLTIAWGEKHLNTPGTGEYKLWHSLLTDEQNEEKQEWSMWDVVRLHENSEHARRKLAVKEKKIVAATVSIAVICIVVLLCALKSGTKGWCVTPFLAEYVFLCFRALSYKGKEDALKHIIMACESLLGDFKMAVDRLNPARITIRWYDAAKVRDVLVGCAVRKLDAEAKFDAARLRKERRAFDIMHHGNWLQKCEDTFEATTRAAAEFNLAFSEVKLFADAKEHLERPIGK